MGRLAPEIAETDMTVFEEGWDDSPWCHFTSDNPAVAMCGARQAHPDEPPHLDDCFSHVCSGCGRPKCPDCEYLAWEQGA